LILIAVLSTSIDAALDMGATLLPDGRGCSFKFWSPHASAMRVEILPGVSKTATEKHTIELQRGDGNHWFGESDRAFGGCDYRIALESSWNDCYSTEGGTLFRRDPYARYAPDRDSSFCRIDDRGANFKWSSDKAPMLLSRGLGAQSIYELHVGTFSPEGTFRGATERLDHVAELGFTVTLTRTHPPD
jgi:maltooligosyltrehalose trehalohydrolase